MNDEEMIEKLKKIGGDPRVPIEHVQDIIDMMEALAKRLKFNDNYVDWKVE